MEFFDTHCHLDFNAFKNDRENVITNAVDKGVTGMLTIGTCLESSRKAIELAESHENVYAAAGIHPNHCLECSKNDLAEISIMSESDNVIAIGETGLDFFRNTVPVDMQKQYFTSHMETAQKTGKPLILHSRDSGEELISMVKDFFKGDAVKGVFHCFTSTREVLENALELGLKIGISGILTFPKGENVRELIPFIPDDYLLLDSDSPFLSPAPNRGKRNVPANVIHIAEKIAEIRGVSLADIARITTRNARELFNIKSLEESKIAYVIRNSLYIALTNRCTNNCTFCARNKGYRVKGHDINIEKEPNAAEVIAAMGNTDKYEEVCFCGFGEPTIKLEVLKDVADELKKRGKKVRLNTNGQGSIYHKKDIVPELKGRVDTVSVSINTSVPSHYQELCHSEFGDDSFAGVCDFVKKAVQELPEVICTVVDMPGIDIDEARKLVDSLGAKFRVRSFVDVG
ncbi:MAG: YchF/TatD family DNA exonuclease [Planctomycetota bacterium]|jgi:TatD DNase family protein